MSWWVLFMCTISNLHFSIFESYAFAISELARNNSLDVLPEFAEFLSTTQVTLKLLSLHAYIVPRSCPTRTPPAAYNPAIPHTTPIDVESYPPNLEPGLDEESRPSPPDLSH